MKKRKLLLLIYLVGFFSVLSAQQNVDSIFNEAIALLKDKKIQDATKVAEKALSADPKRGDICVFLANLNSWQNNNQSGLNYIQQAAKLNYKNDEFYLAWSNILIRSEKYQDLLANSADFEKNYTNKDDFFQKKIIALAGVKQYDDAARLIKTDPQKRAQTTPAVSALYSDILLKRNRSLISAYYTLDVVDLPVSGYTPQNLASLGYSFPIGKHSLGFRANYANRFGLNDVQLEADFYLKFKNSSYTYFNYGYAFNATLFPQNRFGIEHYFPLFPKTDASLGVRLLNYNISNSTSNVYILTGHVGHYFGKSWISVRPYYVIKTPSSDNSFSVFGNYRLFGKNELNYWGIEVGAGNSPDYIYYIPNWGNYNQLSTYKLKLERNFRLDRVSDLHVALGYAREQFGLNTLSEFRNRMTVELGYKLRIR
jgi:YaiO family outer membrane protein